MAAASNTKIKGGDLMLFLGGYSVALATNHTLEISGETTDTSNKDEGGGMWASSEVSKISWTITTENLYTIDGEGKEFSDLFTAMANGTQLDAVFATKLAAQASLTHVPEGGWTPVATVPKYSGKVVVTSLSLNAQNGEYATFSATLTGVGALTQATAQ